MSNHEKIHSDKGNLGPFGSDPDGPAELPNPTHSSPSLATTRVNDGSEAGSSAHPCGSLCQGTPASTAQSTAPITHDLGDAVLSGKELQNWTPTVVTSIDNDPENKRPSLVWFATFQNVHGTILPAVGRDLGRYYYPDTFNYFREAVNVGAHLENTVNTKTTELWHKLARELPSMITGKRSRPSASWEQTVVEKVKVEYKKHMLNPENAKNTDCSRVQVVHVPDHEDWNHLRSGFEMKTGSREMIWMRPSDLRA